MFQLWKIYTWISNIIFILLELLPMQVRDLFFLLIFKDISKIRLIDYKTYFRYPWKIKIGAQVSINRGCMFLASGHSKGVDIEIGNHCVFAPNVKLLSAGHDYKSIDLPHNWGKIIIGDNVWIGAESIILQGVTIGDGAVVGAGSVVSKDIPPWSVAVGNPARIIKKRVIDIVDKT